MKSFRAARSVIALAWRVARGDLAVLCLTSTATGLTLPVVVWLTKRIINDIASGHGTGLLAGHWIGTAAILGLCFSGLRMFQGLQACRQRSLSETINVHAESNYLRVAAGVDLSYLEDPARRDQMAQAAKSLGGRMATIIQGLAGFWSSILTSAGMLWILLAIDPWLVLLALAFVLVNVPQQRFQALAFHNLYDQFSNKDRQIAYVRFLLTECRPGKEVRAYGLAPHLLWRHRELAAEWSAKVGRMARVQGRWVLGMGLAGAAVMCAAYLIAISGAAAGTITVGGVAAVIGALGGLTGQLAAMSSGLATVGESARFVDDYLKFVGQSPRRQPAPADSSAVPDRLSGGIVFDDVHFSYPGAGGPALRGLSLKIDDGELLAIVGGNGAGKTTLIKLLLRFYDPDHGTIRLGGADLRQTDPEEVRSRIGVLFQDFVTYNFKIRDNIAFGRIERTPTDHAISIASRAAQLSPVIERWPEGLDSRVGQLLHGGHDMSGGELQRLALARLIYRGAEIWVLDEPTSGLDVESEAAVFAEVRNLLHGRIGIIISHRFSTVRMADKIAVMTRGRIAELGTHEELIARRGHYSRLFEMQSSAYSG